MNKHATPFGEIHLVAVDLDGTLLQPDMRLSDRARNAILRIQKTGVEVVIASGRPYCSLPETVTQLPGLSYAITSNGAAIHRLPDGARIWGSSLSQAAVEVILAETAHFPVLLEAYIAGVAYTEARYFEDPVCWGNPYPAYIWNTRKPVADMRSFLQQHCRELDGITVVCMDPAVKRELSHAIGQLAPEVYLTASCSQLLEIADRQAGKAAALQRICQKKRVPLFQCAAFGNGENDSRMLQEVGLGVAVANAEPECLAAADLIAEENKADGVAQVMEAIAAAREAIWE